ncbi:N-acetylmuramoyl-L-alanine amidase isoform X2 [Anser cygnoides]|uniref:N-acetylmuramoyl-L-alanine amidase isoform X2 n=1 Tax=Anser cygnoides TaxID=8845 RepID=UPI0034D2ADA3
MPHAGATPRSPCSIPPPPPPPSGHCALVWGQSPCDALTGGRILPCAMLPWLVMALSVCARLGTALPPRHMDTVVQIVEALEAAEDLSLLELARALGSCSTPGCRAVLGDPPAAPPAVPALSPEQWALLTQLLHPDPTAPERGVVLAPDGSTVALAPLLTGVEVGLRRAAGWSSPMPEPPAALDALYAVTITEALGTAFLLARAHNHSGATLGPDGCWDDVENPQSFTLLGPPSPVPEAIANGALDGVLLGARLAEAPVPLALLLRSYYGTDNGTASGRPLSSYRRRDFGALTGLKKLEEEVVAMLRLLRVLPPTRGLLEDVDEEEEVAIARQAAWDFMETYVAPRAAPSPPAPTPCAPCSASTRTPVAGMTSATGETNGTITLLPSPSPHRGPRHPATVPVTPPWSPSPHRGPCHPTVVPITLPQSLSPHRGPHHSAAVPITPSWSPSPHHGPRRPATVPVTPLQSPPPNSMHLVLTALGCPQLRGGLGWVPVPRSGVALGGCPHQRPQHQRLRRGLRGQLLGHPARSRRHRLGARRPPALRRQGRPAPPRLHPARPPAGGEHQLPR